MFQFSFNSKNRAPKNSARPGPARRFDRRSRQGGFFLTELIVAVFIFGIVMTVSMGTLVLAIDANKKAQSLKSVLNNLNIVLDTITRNLATGSYYRCSNSTETTPPFPYGASRVQDCKLANPISTAGGNRITFLANQDLGDNGSADDVVSYTFNSGGGSGYIERTEYLDGAVSGVQPVRMTAPEVNITGLKFYVTGSTPASTTPPTIPPDLQQPKVLIVINGSASAGPRNQPTTFTVQTLVSQLIPDFK